MPEMKKYLNSLSAFQRMLYYVFLVFVVIIIAFFLFVGVSGGFPFGMMLMPVVLFIGFGAFVGRMFFKARNAYDKWWSTLSDAEHTEIEQDFLQTEQLSYYLLAGRKYAFIRNAGCAIPYDVIEDVELLYGRGARCYAHIHLKGGNVVHVDLPSFADGEQLYDDLLNCCHPMEEGMPGDGTVDLNKKAE